MRESRCETVRAEDLMESETAGMGWRQPAFDEVIDVSDEMRERRRNRRSMRMMYAIGALLIVAAICIGGFPAALQYRAAVELSRTSAQSARTIAGWPYPQADDAFAAAKSYNERLAASGQPILGEAKDPFAAVQGGSRANETDDDDGSASSKDEEYQGLLDSGGGVMGTIRIPKISVNLPIYHGTSQSALASGAGHLYGSSLPVGGKNTHAVITGHRGLVNATMFTRLDEMRVGDYFYLDVMGHTLGYQVDRISVIEPKYVKAEDRARRGSRDADDMHAIRREHPPSAGFRGTLVDSRRDSRRIGRGEGCAVDCDRGRCNHIAARIGSVVVAQKAVAYPQACGQMAKTWLIDVP